MRKLDEYLQCRPGARFCPKALCPGKPAALLGAAALLLALSAPADPVVWNWSSGDRNWSTAGNWSGGVPASTNDLFFNNTDAQAAGSPVNTVDASTTVSSLWYTNSSVGSATSYQNTTVASGQTLTVTNGLNVTGVTVAGATADIYTTVDLTGAGGKVAVTGGLVAIGHQSAGSGATYTLHSLLDLRGLDEFSYSNTINGNFSLAGAGQRRAGGEVYLAGTNSIVAPAMTLGYAATGSSAGPGKLHLGAQNSLFVDTITVGRLQNSSLIDFEAGLDNPSVKIRGKDGVSAVGTWYVGWNPRGDASGSNSAGTNDFSGGILDAAATNLYVGYFTGQGTTGSGKSANGYFTLGTNSHNSLVVQNLYLGAFTYAAPVASMTALGVFSAAGGSVTADTVTLAQPMGLGVATGKLQLRSGATMNVSGNVADGSARGTISVSDATLSVGGVVGSPTANLGTLSLSNATLGLRLVSPGGYTNAAVSVSTLNIDGAAGTTVLQLNSTNAAGQYPVIAYSSLGGSIGFDGLRVQAAPGTTASLVNNMSGYPYTVDVVITAPRQLVFTTPAFTSTAGQTSGTLTVQLQENGVPLNTSSNLTVYLSSTSGTGIFRDVADTTTITSVVIGAGSSSASFKYTDTTADAPTLSANPVVYPPAAQQETILAGPAVKLGFRPQPVNSFVALTMAPVGVQIQDTYGNPVPQAGATVNLVLNGGALASGTTTQFTDSTGQALFSDLLFMGSGSGLYFSASASGYPTAASASFEVTYRPIVKAKNNLSLDQAASWNGGVVPGQYDIAVFDTTSVANTGNPAADLGSWASWYGVAFSNWSANATFTIQDASGSTLSLGGGGLAGNGMTHTLTVEANISLATNQAWQWDGTGSSMLHLNGGIDTAGYRLTVGGSLDIYIQGSIYNGGGLLKQGSDTVTLAGANSYTGLTTVSNGTLLVNGSLSGAVSVAGGTLGGSGSISGAVTLQNGQLAPGGSGIGTLTLSSDLTLNPASSVLVRVDPSAGASDSVVGLNHLAYGGTLVVTNLAGTLAEGSQFTLFSAATPTGNFSRIAGTPGAGLAWSFNPTNGVLSVVSGVATNPTNITAVVSNRTLALSWPADHLGWVLQAQTNSAGIGTNWVDVGDSSAGTSYQVPINPANPPVFFRLRCP